MNSGPESETAPEVATGTSLQCLFRRKSAAPRATANIFSFLLFTNAIKVLILNFSESILLLAQQRNMAFLRKRRWSHDHSTSPPFS
jgi:hypothetical protein